MNSNGPKRPRKLRSAGVAGRQECRTKLGGGVAKASFHDQRAVLEAQCTELRAERDELKAQLSAANARVRALEDTQKDVINRIDWVLDSIHNLVDS